MGMLTQVERLFAETPVPAAAVGSDRRVLFANPALVETLALPASPVGSFCYDMFRARGPDGSSLCTPACRRLRKSVSGDFVPPMLMWCPRNGGPPAVVEGFLFPLETARKGNGSGLVLYLLRPVQPSAELRRKSAELSQLHRTGQRIPASADSEGRGSCSLSRREAQVLVLLQDGLSTREIGARLRISPATVRNHVQRVLGKLKAHSRLQAVMNARRMGWL